MKSLVWFCALLAGFWLGKFTQRYWDERDYILVAKQFVRSADAAKASCDETAFKQAVLVDDYISASCP